MTWWASDRVVLTRTAVSPGFHVGNIAGLDATDTSPRQERWVEAFAEAAPDPFESQAVLPERWRGWISVFDSALELERADALLAARHRCRQLRHPVGRPGGAAGRPLGARGLRLERDTLGSVELGEGAAAGQVSGRDG